VIAKPTDSTNPPNLAGRGLQPRPKRLYTQSINKMLSWEMQLVQQSPILRELLVEKFQTGREEGRRLELLKTLYKLLTFRFGVITKPFEELSRYRFT